MRALLVPIEGGKPIELEKDLTVVGRKEDCDLRLDHKSVSKLHCVLVKSDGLLLLRDLGSTNSTRVNGQRVRRAALLPNDQLTIANYKFRVQFTGDEPPVQPNDHTQQLQTGEVANMLRHPDNADGPLHDSDEAEPPQPVQLNPLPDVYPEDPKPKGR
jgi:pSer/pThr/pTyr-binding forkhead associated (FHA) protein